MKLTDFDYHLPQQQIANYPAKRRDHSRLLVYDRKTGQIWHKRFYDVVEFFDPDDFLVVNTTRVLKARLFGSKTKTGGKFELLLLRELEQGVWESLVKPGRGMNAGVELSFGEFPVGAEVVDVHADGSRTLRFHPPEKVYDLMEAQGIIPLPPYIQRQPEDSDYERYQTVYNRYWGSVAAPTAGLHFTPEILQNLKRKGIEIAEIILDIGWGTFQPIRVDDPRKHQIEFERYRIEPETALKIKELRGQNKNLVAVGTTSVRALESWYKQTDGSLEPISRDTDLFIYPPYQFKLVDKLITNFHLPKSTLLMLVSAFAGRENILRIYSEAVAEGYRFFSYGDSMMIL
ncbi:MAG TPA: tRNA preQ1(34) S-adenosylmethionine ribosyltransferase-isomerase QueA [candidate division Zixibacteria bacterium]|nr:tRNA preQ1(34) S-adenosylmethionine ribosyltransferase-isomerase QueA [candidate division Zixibacteria bacterium]